MSACGAVAFGEGGVSAGQWLRGEGEEGEGEWGGKGWVQGVWERVRVVSLSVRV